MTPAVQVVLPVAAHTPTPHEVGSLTKDSSVAPSQSLSVVSQSASMPVGSPASQVSPMTPAVQVVLPVAAHTPTPHAVGSLTKDSSVEPSQSLSVVSQSASMPVGSPASQVSPMTPAVQVVLPVAAHTPTPHEVGSLTKDSSVEPSQSLSVVSQSASMPVGSPASQVSPMTPAVQVVLPVAAHTPTPHEVGSLTKDSSVEPSQSLSVVSQSASMPVGSPASQVSPMTPAVQVVLPVAAHTPTPHEVGSLTKDSSVEPSQSLSVVSQSASMPVGSPASQVSPMTPAVQVVLPVAAHTPTPHEVGSLTKDSSVEPSQSLSVVSQSASMPVGSPASQVSPMTPAVQVVLPVAAHTPTPHEVGSLTKDSSVEPSQSLSVVSQSASMPVGSPASQVSPMTPAVQVVLPVAAHTPTPHEVGSLTKDSSVEPSQSLSVVSQSASMPVGSPASQVSPMTPAVQVVLPVAAHTPTPHEVGSLTKDSSVEPSQSLSVVSQSASMPVGSPASQVSPMTPAVQVVLPVAAHTPTPHEVGSLTKDSSVEPSQSLSVVSQSASMPVGSPASHESDTTPFVHFVAPLPAQMPTPQVVGSLTNDSSVLESQSLSTKSQSASSPVMGPGLQVSVTWPLMQAMMPVDSQTPEPQVVPMPSPPKSSSVCPSQSSSTPSQKGSPRPGVPGVQESPMTPAMQVVIPIAVQID
jgi:hypothetical protein